MCIYDRNAFECGHQEWGTIKAQCAGYWRKCCIRTGQECFTHQLSGVCHTCQVRRLNDNDIGADDSIHLTIRLKPSMAMEKAASDSAKGRSINSTDLPTPENVRSYIATCVKRYQQAHNIPEDSIKICASHDSPAAGGSRATGDVSHYHSCGQSHPNCKGPKDYQMQLLLREHQAKRQLVMAARGKLDAASAAPEQPIMDSSLQAMRMRHYKLQDYQRELMREALHAKQEQPPSSALSQEGIVPTTTSPTQNPSTETMAKNFSLEEFQKQNVQAMNNLSLNEYQKQLMVLRCGNSKRDTPQFQPAVSGSSAGMKEEPRLASREPHRHQQTWEAWERTLPSMTPMSAGAPPVPARASVDSVANADHLKKRQHQSLIEDYNMQLMLLEQRNRKRLMMARQEHDKVVKDGIVSGQDGVKSQQQDVQNVTAAKREHERLALDSHPNTQEREQILEMGSALRAQNGREKHDVPNAVNTKLEDELDTGMWSTDECDEWSNCEDDFENVKKVED